MTTYTLLPQPIWNSFDLTGRAAGGAQLFSFDQLNFPVLKPIFQDSAGALAWPNPIPFKLNGEAPGPFFFADDTPYYLVLTEAPIPGGPPIGNTIWQMQNYSPSITGGGGGGGGGGTTVIPVKNHIVNGVFNYNIGTVSPLTSTSTVLAPSAHDIGQPDIRFIKNAATSTDEIVFQPFLPIGGNELTPDTTPEYYLQYNCTNDGGESQKSLQFPIVKHVQNLSGRTITMQFWAKDINNAGNRIKLFWYQFFGNGGAPSASAPVQFIQTPFVTLTGSWKEFTITETVPSVSGKTLGTCGNDALYLQFGFPTGNTCQIAFTKPEFYLGSIVPAADFSTYDEIDAIINSPRTGDIRTSFNSFYPFGWVPMNDGTIGNNYLGTSSNASTRANQDTFQLFDLIWNTLHPPSGPTYEQYAPMFTSAGVPIAYGASSIIDFDASRQLSLTKALGQVFAGTAPLIPPIQTFSVVVGTSTTNLVLATATASEMSTGTPVVLTNTGTFPVTVPALVAGTVYYAITVAGVANKIKLARTLADALAGTAIVFSVDGTGSITVNSNALGLYRGEELHTMTTSELVAHTHGPGTYGVPTGITGSGFLPDASTSSGGPGQVPVQFGVSGSTGSTTPFNTMQPTTYMNVFIKL